MSTAATPITIAYGDGIGPEIMEATLEILRAGGARIAPEKIEIGQKVYEAGNSAGIEEASWDSLRRTKVFLKAPITTPQGSGFKSLNVTVRKTLGLYANVRPCRSFHPFIQTKHPVLDLVIVRENEEDTYAGIEYRQSDDVTHCIKLITRKGSEKIVRYAFEYARANNRKKVSAFVKDNIMKITDGLFHQVFKEIAAEYPDIASDSWIVDIGAARLADTPEIFDVLVMENLYGDIMSDIAAQIAGSVGLGGSSNIGEHIAMFEAIHGSAPPIAGMDIANPSGLLLGAIMMLVHIDQQEAAERIHNAWLRTIEDGIHTQDIYREATSTARVGTRDFAKAVVARMGQLPEKLKPVAYVRAADERDIGDFRLTARPRAKRELVGADIYAAFADGPPSELGALLSANAGPDFRLAMMSNRGVVCWPVHRPETSLCDTYRCRFVGVAKDAPVVSQEQVLALCSRLAAAGTELCKMELLFNFDGRPGYSRGQGE